MHLSSRSAGSTCTAYEASVRADGTVTVGRERCTSRLDKSWERGTGEIDLYEVDRLVRLFETVGFEKFSPKYLWGIDHAEASGHGSAGAGLDKPLCAPQEYRASDAFDRLRLGLR
jgi:hypothetical protein